ncbi:putative nucleic acid-binding protein [Mucilaginibacter rubeus]|uniref:PIN domain-containing protein n=1 Tax=Mucilaginibacter rubeus TaxID=2027860 RepID=UPI0033975DD7
MNTDIELRIIFDSNVFDLILDRNVAIDLIKRKATLFTTNVQWSELMNVPNEARRTALLNVYDSLKMTKLFLESGIWLDAMRWDDDQIWHDNLTEDFKTLVGNSKPGNNSMDAHIGEIAKKHNLILITRDESFGIRGNRLTLHTMTFDHFIQSISDN